MVPEKQISAFLKLVLERTSNGQIEWRASKSDQEFESFEEVVGYPSVAQFGENLLRIAKTKYKYWFDEDTWEWESRIVLDFTDARGKMLWRFPARPIIPELFEIVRFTSSGIADSITAFLKEAQQKK